MNFDPLVRKSPHREDFPPGLLTFMSEDSYALLPSPPTQSDSEEGAEIPSAMGPADPVSFSSVSPDLFPCAP